MLNISNAEPYTWYYSTDGSTWSDTNIPNPSSSILLDGLSADALSYVNRVIASFGN